MKVESPYFPHIIATIATTLLFTLIWIFFTIPLMAIFETDGPFGFPPFSRYLLNFILLLVGINLFINFPLSRLIEHLRGRDFYWGFLLSGGFLMLSSLIYQMLPALPRLFKYISSLVGFAFLVYWLIFILTQRFARQA